MLLGVGCWLLYGDFGDRGSGVRVCACVLCVLGKLSGEMDPLFVFAQDRRVLLAILTESMFS